MLLPLPSQLPRTHTRPWLCVLTQHRLFIRQVEPFEEGYLNITLSEAKREQNI